MPLTYAETPSHPYFTSTVPNMYGVGNPVSAGAMARLPFPVPAYADYVLTHSTLSSLSFLALLPSRASPLAPLPPLPPPLFAQACRAQPACAPRDDVRRPGLLARARRRAMAGPRVRESVRRCAMAEPPRACDGVQGLGPIVMRAKVGPVARARQLRPLARDSEFRARRRWAWRGCARTL
ncbi:hypothetical protein DFH11DRAFT_1743173 [Phellopilus nigrolimitatus]|nr:hypothetical protein DFH11DRAFT_1743173 [Phellopilus nigrolimitatus]